MVCNPKCALECLEAVPSLCLSEPVDEASDAASTDLLTDRSDLDQAFSPAAIQRSLRSFLFFDNLIIASAWHWRIPHIRTSQSPSCSWSGSQAARDLQESMCHSMADPTNTKGLFSPKA